MTDPAIRPLTYPGRTPVGPGVLDGDHYRAHRPGDFDHALTTLGARTMSARQAMVAVGSNASPARLRGKFRRHGISTALPMAPSRVTGLAAGVSAHVGMAGYVPATPVPAPGEVTGLWVIWPDRDQLEALDATERNYDRILLGPENPVVLASGDRLDGCALYVSLWGCLIDGAGRLRRSSISESYSAACSQSHRRCDRGSAARRNRSWNARPIGTSVNGPGTSSRPRAGSATRPDHPGARAYNFT